MVSLKNSAKLLVMGGLFVTASIFGAGCQADKAPADVNAAAGSADQLAVYVPSGSSKLLSRLQEHHFNIIQLETQSESSKLVKSLIGADSNDYFIVLNPKFNRVVYSASIPEGNEWSEVDKTLEQLQKINDIGPKQLARLQSDKPNTVRLAVFSDFQCPFCRKLDDKIEQWQKKYGDKIDVLFMQFPLPMHPLSRSAALASECARDQGQFDAYRLKLFASQDQMKAGKQPFMSIASNLGLKKDQFTACLQNPATKDRVDTDLLFGNYIAVKGTPTFFINGELIDGLSEAQIVKKLDDLTK